MDYITVVFIAIALGADALSMAIGLGTSGIKRIKALIISAVVAIFHVVMPLIGLYFGLFFGKLLGTVASILGALVLAFIGGNMIWDTLKPELPGGKAIPIAKRILGESERVGKAHIFTGAAGILVLAASVSFDALTVGFGLGTLNADILFTVIAIGSIAGFMTLGGFIFGSRLGEKLGEKAQFIGGILLIGIGLKIFLEGIL